MSYLHAEIGQRLFVFYCSRSYLETINDNSSNAIRNLTTETENVKNLTINTLIIISEILVAIFLIGFLIFINPKGTLIIFAIMFLSYFTYSITTKKKLRLWGDERAKLNAKITKKLIHAIDTLKMLKLYDRNKFIFYEFAKDNFKRSKIFKKFLAGQNYIRLYIECFSILTFAALILFLVDGNKSFDEIAILLSVYGLAAFRLIPSINRILSALHSVQYNTPSLDIVSKLLKKDNAKVDDLVKSYEDFRTNNDFKDILKSFENKNKQIKFEKLNFENVSFSYNYLKNEKRELEKLNFEILVGDRVGIIGESGSGKSTLIDLVLGLLEPDSGIIKLNDNSISLQKNLWQKNIGYVPQDIYLVDDTISRNIAIGLPEEFIDAQKVYEACKKAEIDSFINTLPEKYETKVGERGVRLSGGQVQRIGIARALYHNPKILVFDEATSALDMTNEINILNTIKNIKDIDLLVIVSHKESSIKYCNKIIRLKKGRLVN